MSKGQGRFEAERIARHANPEAQTTGDWWDEIGVDERVAKKALISSICWVIFFALIVSGLILIFTGVIELKSLAEVQR